MNGRARIIATFLMAALSAASIGAFDFGLILSDDSSVSASDDTVFSQENKALLWLSLPLGESLDIYASGFYIFEGSFSEDSTDLVPWRFDAARVELAGLVPIGSATLRYSIGRIPLEDFSTRVLAGLSDGARAEVQFGNASVFAAGGYRGLLFKEDARSFIDAEDYEAYADDEVYFSVPRAFAALGFRLNEYIPWHDFGLQAWAQFDLDDSGTRTHTQYVEPFIEGRIGRPFRWRAWVVGEFGYDDDFFWAMAAGARLRYSAPEIYGLMVTQSVLWASGANGDMRAFTPIRQSPLASISSRSFSDSLSYSLDISANPAKSLTLAIAGTAVFRTSDEPPTDAEIRDDGEGWYLGSEALLRASLRPASDLSLNASGGAFFPNTATMYASDVPIEWTASVSIEFKL